MKACEMQLCAVRRRTNAGARAHRPGSRSGFGLGLRLQFLDDLQPQFGRLCARHRVALADGTEVVARVIGESDTPSPDAGTPVHLRWKPGALRLHVN